MIILVIPYKLFGTQRLRQYIVLYRIVSQNLANGRVGKARACGFHRVYDENLFGFNFIDTQIPRQKFILLKAPHGFGQWVGNAQVHGFGSFVSGHGVCGLPIFYVWGYVIPNIFIPITLLLLY